MSNIIELKSKGQVRKLAIQNPELFDEVVRAMGYVKQPRVLSIDTLQKIIAEEKAKWEDINPDNNFAYGVLAGIEAIEFRVNEAIYGEAQTKGGNSEGA